MLLAYFPVLPHLSPTLNPSLQKELVKSASSEWGWGWGYLSLGRFLIKGDIIETV